MGEALRLRKLFLVALQGREQQGTIPKEVLTCAGMTSPEPTKERKFNSVEKFTDKSTSLNIIWGIETDLTKNETRGGRR